MGPLSIAAGLGGAGGAALGAAAVIAWSFSPWGAETKLDAARVTIAAKTLELATCQGEKAGIETARSNEATAAKSDFDAIQRQCATAGRAGVAQGIEIGRIVNSGTEQDDDGAPRRSIIGADSLRRALGQAAAPNP